MKKTIIEKIKKLYIKLNTVLSYITIFVYKSLKLLYNYIIKKITTTIKNINIYKIQIVNLINFFFILILGLTCFIFYYDLNSRGYNVVLFVDKYILLIIAILCVIFLIFIYLKQKSTLILLFYFQIIVLNFLIILTIILYNLMLDSQISFNTGVVFDLFNTYFFAAKKTDWKIKLASEHLGDKLYLFSQEEIIKLSKLYNNISDFKYNLTSDLIQKELQMRLNFESSTPQNSDDDYDGPAAIYNWIGNLPSRYMALDDIDKIKLFWGVGLTISVVLFINYEWEGILQGLHNFYGNAYELRSLGNLIPESDPVLAVRRNAWYCQREPIDLTYRGTERLRTMMFNTNAMYIPAGGEAEFRTMRGLGQVHKSIFIRLAEHFGIYHELGSRDLTRGYIVLDVRPGIQNTIPIYRDWASYITMFCRHKNPAQVFFPTGTYTVDYDLTNLQDSEIFTDLLNSKSFFVKFVESHVHKDIVNLFWEFKVDPDVNPIPHHWLYRVLKATLNEPFFNLFWSPHTA